MRFTIKILCFLYLVISASSSIAEVKIDIFTNYLAGLKSVAMEFNQIDSRGQGATGKLIIQKPHRFRINYYPPYPLLILGNKSEVIMYDFGLQQTTRVNAKENLFNFLLVDMKDWEKNFRIENIFEADDNITAKLYNYATERTISMVLSVQPLELKRIIIDEPDGNVIEVFVENVRHITHADKDLFLLPNPDVFGKPARLDRKGLEKKYR